MTPIVAAVSDAVPLLEQINTLPGMVECLLKIQLWCRLEDHILKGWVSIIQDGVYAVIRDHYMVLSPLQPEYMSLRIMQ